MQTRPDFPQSLYLGPSNWSMNGIRYFYTYDALDNEIDHYARQCVIQITDGLVSWQDAPTTQLYTPIYNALWDTAKEFELYKVLTETAYYRNIEDTSEIVIVEYNEQSEGFVETDIPR